MTYQELVPVIEQLPLNERLLLLEAVARSLREEFADTGAVKVEDPGWPLHFFEQTFGSLRDLPLAREPQGEYEAREDLQ